MHPSALLLLAAWLLGLLLTMWRLLELLLTARLLLELLLAARRLLELLLRARVLLFDLPFQLIDTLLQLLKGLLELLKLIEAYLFQLWLLAYLFSLDLRLRSFVLEDIGEAPLLRGLEAASRGLLCEGWRREDEHGGADRPMSELHLVHSFSMSSDGAFAPAAWLFSSLCLSAGYGSSG